jgi:hypothetical protein
MTMAAATLTLALIHAGTNADAVQWRVEDGGNGHWYTAVDTGLGWAESQAYAESLGGHLATPRSHAEDDFIYAVASQELEQAWQSWIGGFAFNGPCNSAASYAWVTGEPWDFTDWAPPEPNYSDECALSYAYYYPAQWNNFYATSGYAANIEWSADCNGDGIVDYGQILDGTFEDNNDNGVPDCCDAGTSCESPSQNHVLRLTAWPDAAVIPHHQSITPNEAMTIEFWIKTDGSNGDGRPITKRPGNGGCYTIDANHDGTGCVAGNSVFGDCNGTQWGEIPCDWAHLALTVDGETGIARAYLNGTLVSERDQGGPCTIGQGSWELRFGNTPGYSTTQFIGCLDNIRIWNESLDEQQVRYWMQNDITPEIAATLPELGGSWNFEDGVVDATGVNNGWLEGSAGIEAQERPDPVICEGDVNGSGTIDGTDLTRLLAFWGSDASSFPAADINGDGLVDGVDLAMLLGNWGPCQ